MGNNLWGEKRKRKEKRGKETFKELKVSQGNLGRKKRS